jgi:hypothetical protein
MVVDYQLWEGLNGASWVAGAISWLEIFVEPNLVILLNMQVSLQ